MPVDTTAPAAPTGVSGVASVGSVALDWADSAEPDVAGYNVFRSNAAAGTYVKLNSDLLVGSTYVDTTAPASSTVFYQVVAVDSSENASDASTPLSITTSAPPVQNPIRINTGGPAVTVSGTSWSACSALTACCELGQWW